jgi:predicted GIY-YIG superfamily endonuclease
MSNDDNETLSTTVEITKELLESGMSARGGWTREQLGLLGVPWPAPKGWKRAIIGQAIAPMHAQEFIAIGLTKQTSPAIPTMDHGTRAETSTYWLYVLELTNNNFYVGITRNVEARFEKHRSGSAANWTAQHSPLRVLRCVDTGLTSESDSARIEDALTVQTMEQFGRQRVRGGQYCMLDQFQVDAALMRQGQWDRVERAALNRSTYQLQDSWHAALEHILALALRYYAAPSFHLREDFFAALYGLSRYRFWHSDFDAALDSAFWDENGILPVILSFRDDRPLASQCQDAFCVLAGAMMRRLRNGPSFHHLFLFGWTAFVPACTTVQAARVEQWRGSLQTERDRRYDEFTAILLPKMRYLLRH